MKRVAKILSFIFVFCVMKNVYAGTAYVDKIDIDAKINTDGSMIVTETIVWEIEEELNGVYRDILIYNPENDMNSASGIIIDSVLVDGIEFNYSYYPLQNGDSGKYNINNIEDGKQIKIFTPSSDEYKTTKITYTLYDVVVKYNDVAELYWNFIGSGWDYGIDDVSIKITLPGASKTLKIFAHGPLHGYSTIPSTDKVMLEVKKLRSGEMVDARVLFDHTLVDTTKIVHENVWENILIEEAKLAEEANLKRETAKKAICFSIAATVISLIIPILVYVSAYRKSFKANFKGKYYRELPEDYGPALMNKVLYPTTEMASSNDMLATLLDLVRRKYVKIEPIVKPNKKKSTDYLLKLVNEDMSALNESEKHFIQNLIFVDTNKISIKELSKKNSRSMKAQTKAYKVYREWTEIIEKMAHEKDLIKTEKVKNIKNECICVLCLLVLFAVVIYGYVNNYDDIIGIGMIGMFVGIYELIGIFMGLQELNVRTQKGVEHKAMWKAFKRFLQDFSKLDERDYKSIAIWEHYLVYATALGISKKVIKQLKIVFPTEFQENSSMLETHMTINLLSDTDACSSFSSSFSSATSAAFGAPSSSSGSGGGFSDGAGGRWRRRRWWWILAIDNKYKLSKIKSCRVFIIYVEKQCKNRYNIAVKKGFKIMSSYIMHICISDIIKRKLNLTDKFVYGSILPDNIKSVTGDRDKTHYIKKVIIDGEKRNLPDIQKAIEEVQIEDKEIRLGYIAHLVEDLIWFNEFIPTYATVWENNKIQYLKDNSVHTNDEYRDTMYLDYSNSSSYVVDKCGVDIQSLLSSIINIAESEQHKKLIIDNTDYPMNVDLTVNTFMTKESIDKYIEVCTKEVEKIITSLMGE